MTKLVRGKLKAKEDGDGWRAYESKPTEEIVP